MALADKLELDVLVVARTGLGTLNHTALTDRVLRHAGLAPRGVVLNSPNKPLGGNDRANLSALSNKYRTLNTPFMNKYKTLPFSLSHTTEYQNKKDPG